MKIVIKGAGDLATGIASRLYHAGHQIVMTEIAVPLTVRRSVALSRAVYENEAEVEDLKGVLVKDAAEADRILQRGEIPVLVDPEADIIGSFHPDVVVDAILAKKNLGTRITDAPFVIGVGPGFYAGKDCHRDKKRTYTGKCDLGKRSNPKYRSSGKYRRLYNRASDPCQCRWNHGACGRNRRYRRKRPACCQDREAAGLCKDERNCPRNAPEGCTGHRRIEDRRH